MSACEVVLRTELVNHQFTEGQLKPAAESFATTVEGGTRQVTEDYMLPSANAVAGKAVPLAEKLTEDHILPAARTVAEKVSTILRMVPSARLPCCGMDL